jgi:ABC-type glutathione transport system ATPase component
MAEKLLVVKELTKCFPVERGIFKRTAGMVRALDRVSFSVDEFETLGIVGESGSGKTTLAKIILRLLAPTSGEVNFEPQKINNFHKDVQLIFQNPYNSLNPKMRIVDIVSEPLLIHKLCQKNQAKERVTILLSQVGLDESALNRLPLEFSGGQRQRICIARALASEPQMLILDEPISSLDLTMQVEMLDLFIALKQRLKLTYIFISHNLAVIRHIADRVIVMCGGEIVEQARCEEIFKSPSNSYTKLLLEAARG